MKSSHNIAAAAALLLLSVFPLFAFQYGAADDDAPVQPAYQVIATWPAASRSVALDLIEVCGAPDEVTPEALVWHPDGTRDHAIICRVNAPETETVVTAGS